MPGARRCLEVEKSASAKAAEIANDLGMFSRQEKEPRGQSARNLNVLVAAHVGIFPASDSRDNIGWDLLLKSGCLARGLMRPRCSRLLSESWRMRWRPSRAKAESLVQTREHRTGRSMPRIKMPVCRRGLRLPRNQRRWTGHCARRFCHEFLSRFSPRKAKGTAAWAWPGFMAVVTNHGWRCGGFQPARRRNFGPRVPAGGKADFKDNGVAHRRLAGNQTVLMVDDEDLLLTMGQTILPPTAIVF